MAVYPGDRADLSCSFSFIWRAGAGLDRQPRHPAAIRIRSGRPEPGWFIRLLACSDGALAGPKRFCDSGRLLGGGGADGAGGLSRPATVELGFSLCATS